MTEASNISAEVPDWDREATGTLEWAPSRQLLAAIREYQANGGSHPLRIVRRRAAVLRHRFWSVVCAADIPINCRLGGGLRLPHPQGIVIHPAAEVGVNCMLFQQVTLGVGGKKPGAPVLEGHVDVGAGAKILGGVRIGAHARIGANSVVLDDVPAGATAVGSPARVLG